MIYGAYHEDYHLIKVIAPSNNQIDFHNVLLICDNTVVDKLQLIDDSFYANEHHMFFETNHLINFQKDYYIKVNDNFSCHLNVGKVIRSKKLEKEYRYDGFLGIDYHQEHTEFNVWSPVAKEIKLVLLKGNEIVDTYSLLYKDKGLWNVSISGDLEGYGYYYLIRINEEFIKTLDPYAVSSNANSTHNFIVNINKNNEMMPFDSPLLQDALIYELHIKDFTYHVDRSLSEYLKMARCSKIYEHLKKMNVTHLQLQPLNSFAGVEENKKDKMYNWGYNPREYNVPSGWYASRPNDCYNRIEEFREMINAIHKEGFGVILDVVYNHVFDIDTFSLAYLAPGYFFRTDNQGFLTNASWCGNDFASEKYMARKFIIDSLKHWVINYNIDGFRFDLMGLIDKQTIEEAYLEISKIKPNIIFYGEGWNMQSGISLNECANLMNAKKISKVGFFNDYFRNIIRGEENRFNVGFIQNNNQKINDFENVLNGSLNMFNSHLQSINYIECHDNKTLADYLDFLNDTNKYNAVKIDFCILLLAKGIPLMHMGQEVLASKNGLDNTYNDNTGINCFNYDLISKYQDMISLISNLVSFRRKYSLNDDVNLYYEFERHDDFIKFENKELLFYLKINDNNLIVSFDENTTIVFRNDMMVDEVIKELNLDKCGMYVVKKHAN